MSIVILMRSCALNCWRRRHIRTSILFTGLLLGTSGGSVVRAADDQPGEVICVCARALGPATCSPADPVCRCKAGFTKVDGVCTTNPGGNGGGINVGPGNWGPCQFFPLLCGGGGGGGGGGTPDPNPQDPCKKNFEDRKACEAKVSQSKKNCLADVKRFSKSTCNASGGDRPRNCDGSEVSSIWGTQGSKVWGDRGYGDPVLGWYWDCPNSIETLAQMECTPGDGLAFAMGPAIDSCVKSCMDGNPESTSTSSITLAGAAFGFSESVTYPAREGYASGCQKLAEGAHQQCQAEQQKSDVRDSCTASAMGNKTSKPLPPKAQKNFDSAFGGLTLRNRETEFAFDTRMRFRKNYEAFYHAVGISESQNQKLVSALKEFQKKLQQLESQDVNILVNAADAARSEPLVRNNEQSEKFLKAMQSGQQVRLLEVGLYEDLGSILGAKKRQLFWKTVWIEGS